MGWSRLFCCRSLVKKGQAFVDKKLKAVSESARLFSDFDSPSVYEIESKAKASHHPPIILLPDHHQSIRHPSTNLITSYISYRDLTSSELKPTAIIAFDVDDTLIDAKATTESMNHSVYGVILKELYPLLRDCRDRNILPILLTARTHIVSELNPQYQNISIQALAKMFNFHLAYFTNGAADKTHVLDHIAAEFGLTKARVAIVDNDVKNFNSADDAGYQAFLAENPLTWIKQLKKFIRNLPVVEPEKTQRFQAR